jgi:hypothetical protein
MSIETRYSPPVARFDARLADELARWEADQLIEQDTPASAEAFPEGLPNPFLRYSRSLTDRGGFLFTYSDQAVSPVLTLLRVFTWPAATGIVGWLLYIHRPFDPVVCGTLLLIWAGLVVFIVLRPIPVRHSIEIHPEGMTVDGRFFAIEAIDPYWPEVKKKDDREDLRVVCGIFGTRFMEYATVNPLDDDDRTYAVLADDLEMAIEQLWDRRDDGPRRSRDY